MTEEPDRLRLIAPDAEEDFKEDSVFAEPTAPSPRVTAIPITKDGKYVLITQGLSPQQGQELISGLHKWARKPMAQVFVINFGPDVQWQLFGVEPDKPPEQQPVTQGKRPVKPLM